MTFELTFTGRDRESTRPMSALPGSNQRGGSVSLADRSATLRTVEPTPKIHCGRLDVYYGTIRAIRDLNLDIAVGEALALLGSLGSGKTTLLRCLNRMSDFIAGCFVTGEVRVDGRDIYRDDTDRLRLRTRVGMVFPEANPFRRSIFENVAYGLRLHGIATCRAEAWALVETALRKVGPWGQVKHHLDQPASRLSRVEQQCLCIARTLALQPEVILMDEPSTELDPMDSSRIDALINDLRDDYTIVVATASKRQAARVSQRTAFLQGGELIEVAGTAQLFLNPRHRLTSAFLNGTER